ncbi:MULTISPECIES: hypothetical protein [Aminobacter]|uniref:hypothetical protein n=1 Tax=Aminobacter TaxID=31988 RepID=UPI00131ED273|nr:MULTISPECIES: hypothetical protein [Aminobacter]
MTRITRLSGIVIFRKAQQLGAEAGLAGDRASVLLADDFQVGARHVSQGSIEHAH